jgi:hypothetical protein
LPTSEQGVESRVEPKGPEGIKEEVEKRENPERAFQFSGISVFGGVS